MYLVTIINNNVETIINEISTKTVNRISGTIKQGINTIDSFTFTILPNNKGYNLIFPIKTKVKVLNTKTNKYEFIGRVLTPSNSMSRDGLISKTFVCESELAYLLDSMQKYEVVHNISVKDFLNKLLLVHNSKVSLDKQFKLGNVTVVDNNDSLYKNIAYDSTKKNIEDDLINTLGGELQIRYEDDKKYLDYLTEIGKTCTTEIRLAKNIIDITNDIDPTNYITRLYPLGNKLKTKDAEGNEVDSEERLTIASVNNGLEYIDDLKGIEEFGIIEGHEIWDDVTEASNLLKKGQSFLSAQRIVISNKINALDLSLIGLDIDSFEVGNYYPLKHELLDIDYNVRIIEKSIAIENPESTSITFGDKQKDIKQYTLDKQKELLNKINQAKNGVKKELTNKLNDIKNYITYEEFGAKGDGITDDFEAIKKAHDYANKKNISIKANSSKTYYISNVTEPILIKTNVDWNGCTIKINENANPDILDIFKVVSNYDPVVINDLSGITVNKSTKNISKLAGYDHCLVDVINTNKKQFIRKGANADAGYNQTDQFLIDNQGNVLNDIIWNFDNITSITLYPIDEEILNVGNVKFVSVENDIVSSSYLRKGLLINRSNVVVHNVTHEVIENTKRSSPTRGIVYFHTCANVSIKDSAICSRLVYSNDAGVAVGTYDLNHYKVVNAAVENVIDSNFLDVNRWGCHTSNYAKDLKFYNCKLSRIDAHKGIWNLTIRDTVLGQQGLRLIGGGSLIIDNLTSYCNTLVAFRSDYGSNWNGSISFNNINHIPKKTDTDVKILFFNNDMTHDFGYDVFYGRDIQLKNYYLNNINSNTVDLITFSESTYKNHPYQVFFPDSIYFENIKANLGGFRVLDNYLFPYKATTNFSFSELDEVISRTHRLLDIDTNVKITLNDIQFVDNIILNVKGLGEDATDDYTNVKNRIVPLVEINNCKNVNLTLRGFPFVLNANKCYFKRANNANNGTRNISYFNDCNFNPTPSSQDTLGSRFNGITTTFTNCYFASPKYQDGSSVSAATIKNIYNFLDYADVINSLFSYCSFSNCRIDNNINPNVLFPNLDNFMYEFNSAYGYKKSMSTFFANLYKYIDTK